ncbi:MAG: hypothetical protein OEY23_10965 [Acidimicrobiia bacterium]|nr:hypothetical protein [Acidimicrobiia bacterium]
MSDVEHDLDDDELDDDLADIDQPPLTDTEKYLHRLADVVHAAKAVPLSTSAMVNRDELIALIDGALHSFPKELRQSRWLLKERDDFLTKAQSEAEEIIAAARTRAGRMVERSEVVKAADARAQKILNEAEAHARRLRLEVEDYCDQKLGSFEIVLERTSRLVASGREKLQLRSRELAAQIDGDTDSVDAAPDGGPFDADADDFDEELDFAEDDA